ncbi:MAG TPA: PorV/PorQ family protein [Candidatus Latescibacteria bacterium]|nr:PorV/PorQ family protein [Candidatus Latescibacterota bacterium]
MKWFPGLMVAVALVLLPAYQGEATNESQAGVLLLLIEPGARVSGMGESFVTISDDATAAYYNPAGLSGQSRKELTFMHTKWLPAFVSDLYYEFLGYSQYLEGWGNIGINLTYFYLGRQTRTDEWGNELGTFTSYDAVFAVAYGSNLSSRTALGVTVKYIYSHLAPRGAGAERGAGVGHSIAFDLGVLHRSAVPGLKFGAALHNLGPKIAYIDAAQADPLPLNFVVGASYKVLDTEFNDLLVTLDFYKPLVTRKDPFLKAVFTAWFDEYDRVKKDPDVKHPGREALQREWNEVDIHAGIEYVYSSLLALRAGYSYDRDGDLKFLTFGFGFQFDWIEADFAYLPARGTGLENNTRFSITVHF